MILVISRRRDLWMQLRLKETGRRIGCEKLAAY